MYKHMHISGVFIEVHIVITIVIIVIWNQLALLKKEGVKNYGPRTFWAKI
jgi:hypothetical protein